MAIRATRGISNDYDATLEKSEADDSHLTVLSTLVRNLNGDALENYCGIFKVQSTFGESVYCQLEQHAHILSPQTPYSCLDDLPLYTLPPARIVKENGLAAAGLQ